MIKDINNCEILKSNLSTVIELSYDGIFITDDAANTLYINKAYENISGLRRENVIGKNTRWLEETGTISNSATLQAIRELKVVTINQTFKSGKKALVTSTPIFDKNNKLILVITNVRDVSELVKLERIIEEKKREASLYKFELEEMKLKIDDDKPIIAGDKAMMETLNRALRVAKVDSTVLISGETGAGKEVIANIIWRNSKREKKPFIKINCGTIPENLIESEFFGYEKGAFTGAKSEGKMGYFEIANNGTIFLDEVGELPLSMQVKLLRVLQEETIMRIGSNKEIKVNVRVIAATNRNLEKMVEEKTFREDLFYRLNVIPMNVPPLRKRPNDIIFLGKDFLRVFNEKYMSNKVIDSKVFEVFNEYSWPGNVRQLKNTIERMVVLSNGDLITIDDIPHKIKEGIKKDTFRILTGLTLKEAVAELETKMINDAYNRHGNVRAAAKELGIDASTLVRKRKK